jgi:hypothetical protein
MIQRKPFVYVLIVVTAALQFFTLAVAWPIIVEIANDYGRRQRGGVGFGISLSISAWSFIVVLLLGGCFTIDCRRRVSRIWWQLGIFLLWAVITVVPLLSSFPNRGGGFLLMCAIIYGFGSICLLPILVDGMSRAKQDEQDAALKAQE